MNCEICGIKTSGSTTCSIEHGMMWRSFKQLRLNKQELKEISTIKIEASPRLKLYMWKNDLSEEPKCVVCNNKIPEKRIIKDYVTCSNHCKQKLQQNNEDVKTCILCGKKECVSSARCISHIREFKKYTNNIIEYKGILEKEYNVDLFLAHRLKIAGLKSLPKCKYCGKTHTKFNKRHINDCCGIKCNNAFKYKQKSYADILEHYINQGIDESYLLNISMFDLAKIYNSKKNKIIKCICGEYTINNLHKDCYRKSDFNNIDEFNENKFREFINNNLFDIKKSMEHFNCSETTVRRYKAFFEINNACKYSVETDLLHDIEKFYDGDIKRNDRTLIYPKEIDLLFQNFGIEYNGLYWHSSSNKNEFNKNSHIDKTELCEEKGIQLFHIFENEWLNDNTKQIWLNTLRSKSGVTTKLYARNCIIKEIDSSTAKLFFEKTHLQGSAKASIRIGLYYNDELVSVMTFGKPRYNKSVEYELIRFSSKLNTTIVGGASKLLKYFERNYNPKSILSYANRRWSQGNVYTKLGFEFTHNTGPGYFYFKNTKELFNRTNFQKHKLKDMYNKGTLEFFDSKLTETENMYNNGYRKIYDCGNKVYIKRY